MCIHVSYTLIKQFYSPAPYHHIPDGPLVCLASVPFFVEGFGWRPHAGSLQKGDHTFGWLGDIYSLLTLLKDAERAHTVWQDAEQRGGVPTLLLLHVLNTSSQPRQLRDGGRDLIYHDTWSSRDDSRDGRLWLSPRKWYGALQNLVVFVEVARIFWPTTLAQLFSLTLHRDIRDAVWRQEEACQPLDWQAEQCCQEARNWLLHPPLDAESQQEAWMRFDACFWLVQSFESGFVKLHKLQDRNGEEWWSYPLDPLVVRESLLPSLQLPLEQLSNARVALQSAIRKLGRRPTLRRTLLQLASIANSSKQWALMWF